ncbi:hypothetical protein STIAU_4797, partial [Stigmatella aurantiaca DW4/3-1]
MLRSIWPIFSAE